MRRRAVNRQTATAGHCHRDTLVRGGTVTLTLGPNSVNPTMYEYERHGDVDEPFQNRDDLNEYDPEAPLFH